MYGVVPSGTRRGAQDVRIGFPFSALEALMKVLLAALGATLLMGCAQPPAADHFAVAGTRQWGTSTEVYVVNTRTGAVCVTEISALPKDKDRRRCIN